MLTEQQVEAYKRDGYLKNVNQTDRWRKSVRIGYHASEMRPIGMSAKEPNNKTVVIGVKKRREEPRLTYS